jgi:FtsP/CotA-like multicopper oxidase with cupredoxin domain
MRITTTRHASIWLLIGLSMSATSVLAAPAMQCPVKAGGAVLGDLNHDGIIRADQGEITNPVSTHEVCKHLTGGDGFITMADGKELYTFGFSDVTGIPDGTVMETGMLAANFPAPTIELKEGDELYLSLTNVGMAMRPDLFDPHSVHFHGFPQAAAIFDGLPEASATINMGSTFTYYYKVVIPGTYMYHCHVEASEHMQMGMLGNLFVHPAQDGTAKVFGGKTYTRFAYNDGDGSTGFDREVALQLGSMDPFFHDQELAIQPVPFAVMKDKYAMLNGRGYPDTVNPAPLGAPVDNGGKVSQPISSVISVRQGQRLLLRLSNLDVTRFYTVAVLGIPMKVVGQDARLLRGSAGENLYYDTTSLTLGGGESFDAIIDATGVPTGTYFFYCTNLNYLSNDGEDFGGMMTEIVVTP